MGERTTALIVEDSRTQTEHLRRLLEANGYRVSVASSGEAALEAARVARPNVVITDIVMPGMNGFELCRHLKDDPGLDNVPVALLTSLSDAEDVLRGLECGADDFITKPYEAPHLLSRLQSLLLNRQLSAREPARLCMEVHFRGRRHVIDANRMQVVNLLLSSYENAVYANRKLEKSQQALAGLNAELEERVKERTRQLAQEAANRQGVEQQLYQAQKMEAVGRLAGGVAHDFNNMLMVIRGFVDVLAREIPEADRKMRYIGEIRKAVDRSADLTQQLLVFSRKDAPALELLDLNEVVRETVGMLRQAIGQDVALVASHADQSLSVEADRGQLTQVLLNLAVNARDAMPGGGRLDILTSEEAATNERPRASAVLTVRDTGCGMTKDVQDRIFEPFFTTKEKGKGTGLGLSMVYGIITGFTGSISCESEPGRGSVFTVRLPLANPPEGSEGEKSGRVS